MINEIIDRCTIIILSRSTDPNAKFRDVWCDLPFRRVNRYRTRKETFRRASYFRGKREREREREREIERERTKYHKETALIGGSIETGWNPFSILHGRPGLILAIDWPCKSRSWPALDAPTIFVRGERHACLFQDSGSVGSRGFWLLMK